MRWAMASLGRWHLSQLDPRRPDLWMSSVSQCPTCRSPFCLRDIVAVNAAALGPYADARLDE